MKYLLLSLLIFASSAYAYPPDWNYAGKYSEMRGEPIVKLYLLGAGRAYLVANSALEVAGRQKLYCQPSTLALSAEDYVEIFEKSLEKFRAKTEARATLENTEDEMVLFYGLVDTFPCPKK
jgi:hypothetical protein